jgi:hypothetical protein
MIESASIEMGSNSSRKAPMPKGTSIRAHMSTKMTIAYPNPQTRFMNPLPHTHTHTYRHRGACPGRLRTRPPRAVPEQEAMASSAASARSSGGSSGGLVRAW